MAGTVILKSMAVSVIMVFECYNNKQIETIVFKNAKLYN